MAGLGLGQEENPLKLHVNVACKQSQVNILPNGMQEPIKIPRKSMLLSKVQENTRNENMVDNSPR